MTTPATLQAPRHDSALARTVRDFCRQGFKPSFGKLASKFPSNPLWAAVQRTGSELWLDTGDIEEARALWCREFSALTTNNTLLNKEVQKGTYDALIPRAADTIRKAEPKISHDQLVLEIAFVLNAVHALKLVETFDAHVSVEEHTALANDLDAAVEYGKRYYAICPERFYVKVPLTPAGCLAARRLSDAGVPVNFTLGFSARQNYVIGLIAHPAFVNVFMGRLNQFVLEHKLGDGRFVGEKATLASQRVMQTLRSGQQALKTRQIGASMRSGSQVAALVGLDVFTMPVKAAQEFVSMGLTPGDIKNRIDSSFDVTWGSGVDPQADRFSVLWEVPDVFGRAMCRLYGEDLLRLDGAQLAAFIREAGLPDLFPEFTTEERARIAKEGKIPVYSTWRDAVRSGRVSWDALFTAAGLASFAQDQRALDDRIIRLLKG
jgi:transaldolase